MAQFVDGRTKSFIASAALGAHLRVRYDGSFQMALCSASSTDCIGFTRNEVFAVNDPVAVELCNLSGTVKAVALGVITRGAAVYAAASGKVAGSGTVIVGEAMEAATANNDVIEIMPHRDSTLVQAALQPYNIPLTDFAVWNAPATNLPVAGATDDLGIVYGTMGTLPPSLQSEDLKTAGATSNKAAVQFALPPQYEDGETITLRVNCGMKTTIADVTATLDAEAYRQAAPTVDICATAAQSINSVTAADVNFTLTPTNCVAGDMLDILLHTAVNDGSTGTAVIAQINTVKMLLDITLG